MTSPAREDAASDGVPARVVFQPMVDLREWRIVGFEALARFHDDAPPPVHLDRASARGEREELELRLIALAISAARTLPTAAAVTLNASGTTILRPEIDDLLSNWDRVWGLELYEGATTVDLAEVRARVTALGGNLLVDDAGAGCADETRIAQLRPDVVKIDRALFWAASDQPESHGRLDRLLAAARAVGALVLVEGVSEPAHVVRAIELGADIAQGFHLGVPTPAEDIDALIEALHGSIGVDAPRL